MGYHTVQWMSGQRNPLPSPGTRVLIARAGRAFFATVDQHDRVILDNIGEGRVDPAYLVIRSHQPTWWWSFAPAVPGG